MTPDAGFLMTLGNRCCCDLPQHLSSSEGIDFQGCGRVEDSFVNGHVSDSSPHRGASRIAVKSAC